MALMHLENIQVGQRVRPLNEAKVRELMESIRELGLLNPITVNDEGLLIAGFHRLEACRRLAAEDDAWSIVAISYFEHPDKNQQAEIAENLFRHDLCVLERAEHLVIYLDGLHHKLPADEHAKALGMSRKTLFNYRRIVREIPAPLRERIKVLDHELRNATRQLLELAGMPPARQEALVQQLEQTDKKPLTAKTSPAKTTAPRKTMTLALSAELQGRLKQGAGNYGLNQGEFTRRLLEQALQALEQGLFSFETEASNQEADS